MGWLVEWGIGVLFIIVLGFAGRETMQFSNLRFDAGILPVTPILDN